MGTTRTALVTGITGQDGSYLAEFLLAKGYKVFGLVRRLSTPNTERIAPILDKITLLTGDLLDQSSLTLALDISRPDEVYNLAAMSQVGESFKQPLACSEYNALGCLRLLEAIRLSSKDNIKVYQASTSEMFGKVMETPQDEQTPFHPRSPYGTSKLFAHYAVKNYREAYGLYACSGILFNHESPRRGLDFVTRKITHGVACIRAGLQNKITLGNLNSYRDWGYAPDYVQGMWSMLQQNYPEDFVLATGECHSVGEFAAHACECAGLPLPWHNYIETTSDLYRPAEVDLLIGDSSKAFYQFGWKPTISFNQLIKTMVDADLQLVRGSSLRKDAA